MRRLRGWSVAELILVIVIVGTLGAFVGPVLLQGSTAYDKTQASIATYAKMRYAMERMAREIRQVRRSPADGANFDISSMLASSFAFVKEDATTVTLSFSGSVVTLDYGGTAATLTDQVGSFALAYYQQDGSTAATSAANVSFVQVSLTLVEGANNYPSRLRIDLRSAQ